MDIVSKLRGLASDPNVYDYLQKIFGSKTDTIIINQELSLLPEKGSALDVGGGTGLLRPPFPKTWKYTCLDSDQKKINGFHKKFPRDNFILASALDIPRSENTYDLCILSAVSHHLKSEELDKVLAEIFRVLRPDGQLLFLDALLNRKNTVGMLLWALDRGRFPRSLNELQGHIEKRFVITRRREWKVFHEIILFWCKKKT